MHGSRFPYYSLYGFLCTPILQAIILSHLRFFIPTPNKKERRKVIYSYLCADSFSLSFSSVIAWSFCSRFFLFLVRRHRAVIRSSLVVSILLCKNKRPFNALLLCQWHTQCTNQKKSVGETRREEAVSNLLLCNASDGQITAASVVFTVHVFRHWTCSDTILLFRLA